MKKRQKLKEKQALQKLAGASVHVGDGKLKDLVPESRKEKRKDPDYDLEDDADKLLSDCEKEGKLGGTFRTLTTEDLKNLVADLNSGVLEKIKKANEIIYEALHPFVVYCVRKKFTPSYDKEWEDLEQEGWIAVFEHFPKYDITKGRPTTFCFFHVRHKLLEYINENVHSQSQHIGAARKKIENLIREKEQNNIEYDATDLSIETNLPLLTVANALESMNRDKNSVSMDQMVPDCRGTIGELIVSQALTPEEEYIKTETAEELTHIFNTVLSEEERKIFMLSRGFVDGIFYSAKKIEMMTGIPKHTISHISNRAFYKVERAVRAKNAYADKEKKHTRNDSDRKIPMVPTSVAMYSDFLLNDLSTVEDYSDPNEAA